MSPMLVSAVVLVICTQRSFMIRSAVILLIFRSEYLIFDAFRLMSAFRLDGTTIRFISSDTDVVSVVTILKNSELVAFSIDSLAVSGLNAFPALYAFSSSLALTPPDVMSTFRFIRPLRRSALFRPVNLPFAAISDSPATSFRLSMLISLLLKSHSNPRMMFLNGKYGVITIPVLTSMLPLRSHSLKYFARLSSSLMSMSLFLKSSSFIHSGTSRTVLCFIICLKRESFGMSG